MPERVFPSIDRKWLIIGILVLTTLVPVVFWSLQGMSMRHDFVEALRSGRTGPLPVWMWGKQWTEHELAGAEVLKLPTSAGTERALSEGIYDRGRLLLSSEQFEYQGTVKDETTGIILVFG